MLRATRFQGLIASVRPSVQEVTAAEAARAVAAAATSTSSAGKPVLLDVRETSEWEQARIAGETVVHIPRGILERDVEKVIPDVTRPIIVYCAGGMRSLLAADALKRMGYTDVKSLAGGISDWAQRGLPVDAVPKRR